MYRQKENDCPIFAQKEKVGKWEATRIAVKRQLTRRQGIDCKSELESKSGIKEKKRRIKNEEWRMQKKIRIGFSLSLTYVSSKRPAVKECFATFESNVLLHQEYREKEINLIPSAYLISEVLMMMTSHLIKLSRLILLFHDRSLLQNKSMGVVCFSFALT